MQKLTSPRQYYLELRHIFEYNKLGIHVDYNYFLDRKDVFFHQN